MRKTSLIIGFLIAIPSWFTYIQIPSWAGQVMLGVREVGQLPLVGHILPLLSKDPLNALVQLNDYSLIAGIIGITLIIISFFLPKKLSVSRKTTHKATHSKWKPHH